jgi:hypothetical protein
MLLLLPLLLLLLLLPQTLKQFEDEQNAIPAAGAETFNPFEATYATGGSRGKGKGLTGRRLGCVLTREVQ